MLMSILPAPTFVEHPRRSAYCDTGYSTLPLLDDQCILRLRKIALAAMASAGSGFFTSVLQKPDERRRAHTAICNFLEPLLKQHLGGFRIVLASIVGRSPGSGQADLPLHQDWSFVDETRASSMSVWVPLQPVNRQNGCMQVVPGSHRHDQPLRHIGSGFRYASIEADLRRSYLQDIPLDAGEALFFDHRLIHGSHTNETNQPRLAIGAVLLPKEVPLHMGVMDKAGTEFTDRPDDFLLSADLARIAGSASKAKLART